MPYDFVGEAAKIIKLHLTNKISNFVYLNKTDLYAIVDIETTGGYAAAGGITEIAIIIHDGLKVVEKYESLVRPRYNIPSYIQTLTGITNDMVESAPAFEEIASKVYELLHDKVFIAHNVNFDYSFIKYQLLAFRL